MSMAKIPPQNKIEIQIFQINDAVFYYCISSDLTTTERFLVNAILKDLNQGIELQIENDKGGHLSVRDIVSSITLESNTGLQLLLSKAIKIGTFILFVYTGEIIQSFDIQRINGYYSQTEGDAIIAEHQIRQYDFFHQEIFSERNGNKVPIIHVLTGENLKCDNPRYINIADSSIWNHLVYRDTQNLEQFKVDFAEAVNQILEIYRAHYYSLDIAHEYANLNARLVQQAYIEGKNHGEKMCPFLFHSENKMRHRIEGEGLVQKRDAIKKHKWRFLLLDDKYSKYLHSHEEGVNVNKGMILQERLNHILGGQNYILEFAESVKEAKTKIGMEGSGQGRKYDVIFLDYLLENHYGYELLEAISKKCDPIEVKQTLVQSYPEYVGPFGRLFFMFTSAFTTAVSERLVLEGMNRSKDYWYIGEGACPTNTPHLFDYFLINILDKRLQDTGISDLSPENVYNLMYEIFRPMVGNKDTSVRKRANNLYQKVLSLQYHYHRLLDDVDPNHGSELATKFVMSHTHLGGLLEHLVQLVHITAYGSVRQWPEMWEEYLYCKAQFDDYYLFERNESDDDLSHELETLKNSFHANEDKWYDARLKYNSIDSGNLSSQIRQAKKTKLDTLYRHIEQHILSLKSL